MAEVWCNIIIIIRLTLCTSRRAYQTRAGSAAQGHASLGPEREIVLLVFLSHFLLSLFHFFIFHYTVSSLPLFSHLGVPAEVNTHHSAVAPGHRNLMNCNEPNCQAP